MPLVSHVAQLIDEVAKSGSIRQAAERLNISASAVNRHILLFEAEIGVPLFERWTRGVRLTAAGELIVAEVRRWRREEEAINLRIEELQGLRRGHLTIGTMECFAPELIPIAIKQLQARLPRVTVEAVVGGTNDLLDRLADRQIDLALCFNAPERDDVRAIMRVKASTGVVVDSGHPLAGKREIPLSACAIYPFLLPDHTLTLRPVIEQSLARISVTKIGLVTSNSTMMIKSLLRKSEMITILSYFDVYREVQEGQLAYLSVHNDYLPAEELTLCEKRGVRRSGPVELMIRIINEELDKLVNSIPGLSGVISDGSNSLS